MSDFSETRFRAKEARRKVYILKYISYYTIKRRKKIMAKLTAWLVTLIGVLLVVAQVPSIADAISLSSWNGWIIALAVLVIGIGKLVRNYKK